jgi:GAF domain-containing protein/HAMP domain-containing protein
MRNSIRTRLAIAFIALAASLLILVGAVLAVQSYITERQQALILESEVAQKISTQVTSYIQAQEDALQLLVQIQDLSGLNREQQTQLLSNLLFYSDSFDKLVLLDKDGRELAIVSRTEANVQLGDRSTADEYKIPKSTGQTYYSPVRFTETTGEPLLTIAVPVIEVRSGVVAAVLVADVRFRPVWNLLADIPLSAGSSTYIVDSQNRVIAHNNPSIVLRDTNFVVPDQDGVYSGLNNTQVVLAANRIILGEQKFIVVSDTSVTEAFATLINTELTIVVLLLIGMAIAGGLGTIAARQIVRPIEALVAAAQSISGGDLSRQVQITSSDEIGSLAKAFNSMTAQLRDLIGSLEQRVAARTKDLATVAEVGTATATILEVDKLVQAVVDLSKERFNLYHSHIYLSDEAGENLVLASGAGEPGRQMVAEKRSIPLDSEQSLVARAARERQGVIVNDVTQAPDFLPNPLLPDTRSELAVPMIAGGKVIGVFDVQSDQVGRFTDSDINIQTTLAAQVATSIQNVRLFESTQKIAADMSVVANVGIATSTITDAGHLLQEVVDLSKQSFKLYHAHIYLLNEAGDTLELSAGAGEVGRQMVSEKRSIPLDSEQSLVARAARTQEGVVVNDVTAAPDFLPNPLLPDTRSEMAVPMIAAGRVIGVLDVQSEIANRFTEVDVSIQTTLASQVAVALQNARSFSQTQRQAQRETAVNLITQKIQNAATVEAALQVAVREVGRTLGTQASVRLTQSTPRMENK